MMSLFRKLPKETIHKVKQFLAIPGTTLAQSHLENVSCPEHRAKSEILSVLCQLDNW